MLTLELKVVPQSGKQKWALDKTGRLKCYLKSPAQDGKANKELLALLGDVAGVAAQDIVIVKGFTTRQKVVKIPVKLSYEEFIRRLGLDQQLPL